MLTRVSIPGLLVTGTDTGVGKTVVAAAIAQWFRRQGSKVAVCKPCGSGCVRRREGLVSEDAELLAHCADSRHPLHLVCPQRYAEPLAPAVAAEREKRPLDWTEIDRAIRLMSQGSDVMIIEGVGGLFVPMDSSHTFADVAQWLGLPAIVVARPGLGTINHTLLTLESLRSRGVAIAGIVINRYPTDTPDLATESNPRVIEKWGKTPVLCLVPEAKMPERPCLHPLPVGVTDAIQRVDWARLAGMKQSD